MDLRDLIQRLGGAASVAKLLNVSRAAVYRWLSGERVPAVPLRLAMLDATKATDAERLAILSLTHGCTSTDETRTDGAPVRQVAA